MKKLFILPMAALVAFAAVSCEVDNNPVQKDKPADEGGGEVTTPLFPAGTDIVEGIAQPKGALKSIEISYFNESSTTVIWDKSLQTIIYDELGRPMREDVLYYNYVDGVDQGTTRTGGSTLYVYAPGKIEVQYKYSNGEVIVLRKLELNSDGLVDIADNGSDKWQYTYNGGKCTGKKKLSGGNKLRDMEYAWNSDASLYSAKEQWNGPANPDEDGSEYYNYTSDIENPTYKQAYDVSGIVFSDVGDLGGYYFNGLGSSKLPSSVRTTFRNEGKVFTYQITKSGLLVKITRKVWPFADDDPMAKNFQYREYRLSYYN